MWVAGRVIDGDTYLYADAALASTEICLGGAGRL